MRPFRKVSGAALALCAASLVVLAPLSASVAASLSAVEDENFRKGINLTAEGNADWVHWGYGAPRDIVFNRKSGVTSQISDVTHEGNKFRQFDDARAEYQWDDGEPIAGARNVGKGVFSEISGQSTNASGAFEFSVNATTVERIVRIYFGGFRATGHMTLALSDNSAPPLTLDFQDPGVFDKVLIVKFAAGSEGHTLNVRYSFDESDVPLPEGGNISFSAVALEGPRRPEGGITPFLPVLLDD